MNYFWRMCVGWAALIGLQAASFEAISASSSTPIDVKPVTVLDIKATELKLEKLSGLLLQDPKNPQLMLQKGIYLSGLGKLHAAFDIFEGLRVEFSDQPAPYINLASIYAQWGQWDEARSMLMKSSALQGDRLQTQISLASVHMELALDALKKARKIQPDDIQTQARLKSLEKFMTESAAATPFINGPAGAIESQSQAKAQGVTVSTPSRREQSKRAQTTQTRGDQLQLETLNLSAYPIELGAGTAMAGDATSIADAAQQGEVQAALRSWIESWSDRSFEAYANHYSASFEPSDGADLKTWKQRRKTLIESANSIQIVMRVLSIQIEGSLASVRIQQTYRSDRYADKVRKDLLLRLEGKQWKLLSERTIK